MTTPGTYRPSLIDGRTFGIDISRNQGRINFDRFLQADPVVEFCACRTGISWGYKDSMFAIYWDELTKRNIPRMAYHVLYPAENIARQVDNFLSMFPGRSYDGEGPIVNDVELVHGVSKRALSNAAEAFSKALEDATGREVIVYSRFSFLRDFMEKQAWMARRKWWMAQYLATTPPSEFQGNLWVPSGFTDLDVWIVQTGERGDGPYYGTESAQIDTNRWLKSEIEFQALFGVKTPEPTPTPEPVPGGGLRYRVLTDVLNVRSVPSTSNNTPVRQLRRGDIVNLVNIAGSDVWIEIAPGEFCAAQIGSIKYLERV
ncbi:MAG: GH25 family lysozyme [Anaerolineales bacterium]|nr:GH25 family lysozyme [Anaerolineales bacterium]